MENIRLVIEFEIDKDHTQDVKNMIQEGINIIKEKEPGLLSYEFYFNDDETKCYAVELYKDSDALIAHMNIFQSMREEALGEHHHKVTRFELFGPCSEELRPHVAPFNAQIYQHYDGYTR